MSADEAPKAGITMVDIAVVVEAVGVSLVGVVPIAEADFA